MKKMLVVALFVAACGGGGKKKPAQPDMANTGSGAETTETKQEPAGPTEAEKKAADEAAAKQKADADAAAAQAALTEQYEAGKKVYTEKKCASCHGDDGKGNPKNPPVIGEKALPEAAAKTAKLRKGVAFKTAADVEAFVKAKMPLKAPGSLSDDEAFAVTAWILSESKVAIDKKLDASNAASVNLR
jgi:cytochrome c